MLFKGNANDWQTRLRLWAAVIMGCYAFSHTVNIALGSFSLGKMEAFQRFHVAFWRSAPLYWLVPAAIATHISLGLWKVFRRNTFKMPRWEVAQICMGICIPFFLLAHIFYTRGMNLLYGVNDSPASELLRTFPGNAWKQVLMVLLVWGHAQIGVHAILRMRSWYPRVRVFIVAAFTLLPLLCLAGYFMAGFELAGLSRETSWVAAAHTRINWPADSAWRAAGRAEHILLFALPLLYATVLGARGIRLKIRANRNCTVTYDHGAARVSVPSGTTILEASRMGGVAHASICGGRGRCSTCRVRVDDGMDNITRPGERELHVLQLIDATPDVRLACQSGCLGDVGVTRLLPPDITAAIARRTGKYGAGRDRSLVIMFADLRGFTRLSEGRLPYDVVFMLNRYFSYMGEAIEESGGFIDKFLGDGIMALFGLDTDIRTACIQSLRAAKKMNARLDEINQQMKNDLKEPLKIGIGLHAGEVILGEMGYRNATKLTAIGDAVNTASRLEVLNKRADSQLILSVALAEMSGLDFAGIERRRILVRGKEIPMEVYIVKNIGELRLEA